MKEFIGKYVGLAKIKDVEQAGEYLELTLEEAVADEKGIARMIGRKELWSPILLEECLVDEYKKDEKDTIQPKDDLTQLRDKRVFKATEMILKLVLSLNIKVSEVNYLFDRTTTSINEALKKASERLWKTKEEDRTLADVDKILTSKGDSTPVEDKK